MNPFHPSEDDLHAYIDGRLDETQRHAVELFLANNPDVAAEVAGWRQDAQRLRAALALSALPANPALDPQIVRQRRRSRLQRYAAMAAVLVLAIGIGGVGGWQARTLSILAANPPMQDALQAHRLFAMTGDTPMDLRSTQPAALQAWLDQRFSNVSRLPDLDHYGLRPVGSRLLNTDQGAAALLLFEDAAGNRLSLYVRQPGNLFEMPTGERLDGDLEARYWSHAGYNYALVGPPGDPRSLQLQQALSL